MKYLLPRGRLVLPLFARASYSNLLWAIRLDDMGSNIVEFRSLPSLRQAYKSSTRNWYFRRYFPVIECWSMRDWEKTAVCVMFDCPTADNEIGFLTMHQNIYVLY